MLPLVDRAAISDRNPADGAALKRAQAACVNWGEAAIQGQDQSTSETSLPFGQAKDSDDNTHTRIFGPAEEGALRPEQIVINEVRFGK